MPIQAKVPTKPPITTLTNEWLCQLMNSLLRKNHITGKHVQYPQTVSAMLRGSTERVSHVN